MFICIYIYIYKYIYTYTYIHIHGKLNEQKTATEDSFLRSANDKW
jgi:hypothetical protein